MWSPICFILERMELHSVFTPHCCCIKSGGWRLVHGIQFSNFLAQREAVKVVTHLVVYCVTFQEQAAIMRLGS